MTPKELFEILVRENAGMLTVFLRAAVRDSTLVDDLFQETMLTAWKTLGRFDRSKPFGPWLRGIARNLVLAQRRKSARGAVLLDEQTLEHIEACAQGIQIQSGDTLDEKLQCLRDCVEALPEQYRNVVRLRYHDEAGVAELADRLNISVENAKKRLQRARSRLSDCLSGKLSFPEAT